MAGLVAFTVVVGGFGVILAAFVLLALRIRRRGLGGGLMGPAEEIYRPSANRFRFEIEVHEQRLLPTPSADDIHRP